VSVILFARVFWSVLRMDALVDEEAGFIAMILHERDGFGASPYFSGTSACIKKRSRSVCSVGHSFLLLALKSLSIHCLLCSID
jgi:hypothetical protein